jgi:hypothetical protein
VIRHYEMVAEASELPVVIYNFPQMTKITMTSDTVARLAAHPNIIGVKDSAGDFIGMQRYIEATASMDFAVMTGTPALGLSAYQLGAKGGIFAGGSLAPGLCVSRRPRQGRRLAKKGLPDPPDGRIRPQLGRREAGPGEAGRMREDGYGAPGSGARPGREDLRVDAKPGP